MTPTLAARLRRQVASRRVPSKTATVLAAYGWPADLSDDEILARLLALNLERAGTA